MRLLAPLLLLPFWLMSQSLIDTEQFFAAGQTPNSAIAPASSSGTFPWIEDYQFRTETRDFDWTQQEYTLRLSPSTSAKRRAQKAMYEHVSRAPDFIGQEAYCDRLSDKYEDWVSLYLIQEELAVIELWTRVLEDKQAVYGRMVGAYDFDLKELIRLQADQSELAIRKNDLLAEQQVLTFKYNVDAARLVFQDFIRVDQISELIADAGTMMALPDQADVFEMEWIQKEMALERAEAKQWTDFIQLRYQGPHSDAFREKLSIGAGFRIADSGNRKLKMQELELEQKELEKEIQYDTDARKINLTALRQKLSVDVQAYRFYVRTITTERENLLQLGQQIAQKEGFDPLLLLDIEIRHLLTRQRELKRKEDILNDYLNYLEQSGKLCQLPFVNYLLQ